MAGTTPSRGPQAHGITMSTIPARHADHEQLNRSARPAIPRDQMATSAPRARTRAARYFPGYSPALAQRPEARNRLRCPASPGAFLAFVYARCIEIPFLVVAAAVQRG